SFARTPPRGCGDVPRSRDQSSAHRRCPRRFLPMPINQLLLNLTSKKTHVSVLAVTATTALLVGAGALPAQAQQPSGASSSLPTVSQPTGGSVTTITV